MSVSLLGSRSTRLFILLTAFFVGNAIVAEFVGVKIFALEKTLGLPPFGWNLFGQQGSLSFTAAATPPGTSARIAWTSGMGSNSTAVCVSAIEERANRRRPCVRPR